MFVFPFLLFSPFCTDYLGIFTIVLKVLSNQVAIALENFGDEDATETAIFASMFNKFFDCLNVANFSAGKKKRDPFKSPYRSAEDFHLKVCM